MSIAWAVVEHLDALDPRAARRALFATHYHELTELWPSSWRSVLNLRMAVRETGRRRRVPAPCGARRLRPVLRDPRGAAGGHTAWSWSQRARRSWPTSRATSTIGTATAATGPSGTRKAGKRRRTTAVTVRSARPGLLSRRRSAESPGRPGDPRGAERCRSPDRLTPIEALQPPGWRTGAAARAGVDDGGGSTVRRTSASASRRGRSRRPLPAWSAGAGRRPYPKG